MANVECDVELPFGLRNVLRYVLGLIVLLVACNITHSVLRPLSQPRIISELIVGSAFAHLLPLLPHIPPSVFIVMECVTEIGMVFYLLVLGLEMDINVLFHRPTPEARLTYTSILSTFLVASTLIPFFNMEPSKQFKFVFSLSISLSNTASPVLTRLITDLKIGKLEIGRVAINAGMHSDMVTTLLITMGLVFGSRSSKKMLQGFVALLVHLLIVLKLVKPVVGWINDKNPDGKPMKNSHLVLALILMGLVSSWGPLFFISPMASAFLTGLAIPREGRLPKMMINKINYFLNALVFPIYFCWVGMQINFKGFVDKQTWAGLYLILVITTCGRVLGTLVYGWQFGLNWVGSVGLRLLLSTKGHFYIYSIVTAVKRNTLQHQDFVVMILVTVFSILYIPLVVKFLVKWGRIRDQDQMGLQWLDPSKELRMLLCLHGTQNVSTAINILEISRGLSGVTVYATDMIKLTDRIAATLAPGEGVDAVIVGDEMVMSMQEQITNAFSTHIAQTSEGITLHRSLTVSPFNNMHEEICNLAEDSQASIIILPYHKNQRVDGKMDAGHIGYRRVNRKVLRHAPCSVGIFVDRGLGLINKVAPPCVSLNVAVIFIGGKDDREALAYARRMAHHPGINLTVIRFLLDTNAAVTSISGNSSSFTVFNIQEMEEEIRLDDECFAEFYHKYVGDGKVGYIEKYVANSTDIVGILSRLEAMYALFIVGRDGRVNKALTAGMNDWDDCPELGPVGNTLAASDFSIMASVLVIQQYSRMGEDTYGLGDDDFSIK